MSTELSQSPRTPSQIKPCIALMGPTAAGKTAASIMLAESMPVEIISVDSALVYRGMDIGTAKPDSELLAQIPHHLIDIRNPDQTYSAAEFRDDTLRLVDEIHARGRVPVLAGGTMLYYRACFDGLSPLPAADAETRQRLEAEAEQLGWSHMHQRLAKVDPEAAARIHPNDPQRIQRALEVYEVSGRSLSDWHREQPMEPASVPVLKLVVAPQQRSVLHERIERRFEQMLEQGFIEEVKQLREDYSLEPQMPSMRAVGYRQAWCHLEGEYDQAEMRERAVAATRQLAKRQYTWLRRERGALWYDLSYREMTQNIMIAVRGFAKQHQLL